MSDPAKLPAVDWLGYPIDTSSSDYGAFDIVALRYSISRTCQILIPPDHETTRVEVIRGVSYAVPNYVNVVRDLGTLSTKYVTFKNGSEAVTALKTDPTVYRPFIHVSTVAGNPIPGWFEATFRDSEQYAFFSLNAALYSADLRDPSTRLNEEALGKYLEPLPYPFDANKPDTVRRYKDFFKTCGTHTIIGITYGATYGLMVHASNSNQQVNNNFARDVTASVGGITNDGKFDKSALGEEQYKTFDMFKQTLFFMTGGNPDQAKEAFNHPDDYGIFLDWSNVALDVPQEIHYTVVGIWNLLKQAGDSNMNKYANELERACRFIRSSS